MTNNPASPPATGAEAALFAQLCTFVHQAGDAAFAMQQQVFTSEKMVHTKADNSLVTDADLYITHLFRQQFAHLEQQGVHVLIDEETVAGTSRTANFDAAVEKATYIWSLDPVDGTTTFAAGLPLWGASLGVFKHKKPFMSAVYLPALREFYACDGTRAWVHLNHGTAQAFTLPLTAAAPARSGVCVVQLSPHVGFSGKQAIRMNTYASVVNLAWVAAKRYDLAQTGAHLWDIAGVWPLLHHAGCGFFDALTAAPCPTFSLNMFNSRWRLNTSMVACHGSQVHSLLASLRPHVVPVEKNGKMLTL